MRRIYSLPLLTAMALAGLSSCSSSDDPTTDPSVSPSESVKTSFTLSVGLPGNNNSAAAKPSTRVSDGVAQTNGADAFRGIDFINLIPFSATVNGSSTRLGDNNITLPNNVANTLPSGQLTQTGYAKVYNDVVIPLNTTNFLFYGKAVDANPGVAISTPEQKFQYGTITAAGLEGGATSGINFTPSAIFTNSSLNNEVATALTTYLNSIINTNYTSGETSSTWKDYASANGTSSLGRLYTNLSGLYAGSSTSVKNAVQELYTSLRNLSEANLTDGEKALRTAIIGNITNNTYATAPAAGETGTTLTFKDVLNGFPEDINLPDGAATLSFKNDNFAYNTESTSLTDGTQVAALSNYTYPVNLWYFANTPIRTSEEALSDQYTDGKSWSDILSTYGSSEGSVNAGTRSIALEKPIQYAVGRLNSVVKAGATTLLDRKGEPVTVNENTFPVTAIIVGGQRPVDWQFEPVTTNNPTQYTLYDKIPTTTDRAIYATTTNAKANQTLVLETPSESSIAKINIVVELQNNSGKGFTGANGVIPAGSKFYLVAELDPDPTKTGNTDGLDQVFKQDYVTTANLTISANNTDENHESGLGAAYNVIPDLRTPVLSIGMSVDLTWQSGLTFNVDL